jgi:hypothetical protein
LTRRDTAKLAGTLSTQFFAGKTRFLLSTRQRQNDLRDQIHREFVYRPLQFHERGQFFICSHHETLSAAVSLNNEDVSPSHTFP